MSHLSRRLSGRSLSSLSDDELRELLADAERRAVLINQPQRVHLRTARDLARLRWERVHRAAAR